MNKHDHEFTSELVREDLVRLDILRGAREIAAFLGDPEATRWVYHLVATSRLPVFRLGSQICARRPVLIEWIRAQERRSGGADPIDES